MYSCVTAGALLGLTCYLVRVEVDIAPGLPVFNVVGMVDTPFIFPPSIVCIFRI